MGESADYLDRFYAFDPQGNCAEMVASDGGAASLLLSATYDAFGDQSAYPTTYAADAYAHYGAQWGYFTDQDQPLELLGHRYYDAANGRFVTRDPIGYAGGDDLYDFADDSAPRRGDPAGLASVIVGDPNYPIFCFGSCNDPAHPTLVLNYNGSSPFYKCLAGSIKSAYWPPWAPAAAGIVACKVWRPGGVGGGGRWGIKWPGWGKVLKGAGGGSFLTNQEAFMAYLDSVLVWSDASCGIGTYNQLSGVGEEEAL